MSVHLQSYEVTLNEKNKELFECKDRIKVLKDKIEYIKNSRAELAFPDKNIAQIDWILKLWDKLTIQAIVDYLNLDSYEFVKNIGAVVTKENELQTVSYIDWSLQRNEALKTFLSKFLQEKSPKEFLEKKINKKL